MNHIDLLTAYFPPQNSAGANRLSSFVRGFIRDGRPVRVWAARFAQDSLFDDDADLALVTSWIDVGGDGGGRSGFIARFCAEWRIAARLFQARNRQSDILLVTSPYLAFILMSPWAARARKLVIDIRDLSWEYRISASPIVRLCQKILGVWALWALGHADLIITSTESERDYLRRKLSRRRIEHIPNAIELAVIDRFVAINKTRVAPATAARPSTLLYAGTLGRAQGAAILVDVAKALGDVKVHIIGDGVEYAEIQRRVVAEEISNLSLSSRVPREIVLDAYRQADALFLRLGVGFATAVPSKVYEYVAAGRPIIYMGAADDAASHLLGEFHGVHFVPDGDVGALVETVRTLMPLDAAALRGNAAALRRYSREAQADRLCDLLQHLDADG